MSSTADAGPSGAAAIPNAELREPMPQVRTDVVTALEQSVQMVARPDLDDLTCRRVHDVLKRGNWHGNVARVARVASILMDNAVRHGGPFPDGTIGLRVAVDAASREVILEVEDGRGDFPNFADHVPVADVVRGLPHGLWWVGAYGGRVAWEVKTDDDARTVGKTVQVILPAP